MVPSSTSSLFCMLSELSMSQRADELFFQPHLALLSAIIILIHSDLIVFSVGFQLCSERTELRPLFGWRQRHKQATFHRYGAVLSAIKSNLLE